MRLHRMITVMLALTGLTLGGCGNLNMLSTEQEIAMGQQYAPQFLTQGGGEVPDTQVQQYVRRIGQSIVQQIPPRQQRDVPWDFFVLDSAVLNAFALPGGKVFISRGLMEKFDNEAQLAGVLGHEVGHVVAQHIGKQMTNAMLLQTGLSVVSSATESDWIGVLGGYGGQLYLLSFSRSQESESDDLGLFFMVRAGYDPRGLVGVLQVLEAASHGARTPQILSTHPDPARRLAEVKRQIATTYAYTQNNPQYRLAAEPYQQILARLKQLPPPDNAKSPGR